MLLLPNEAEINENQINELAKNTGVVLDFSANWCGPCKKIYPLLLFLANKYENIKIIKIDIDKDDDEIAEKYEIQSLPTLVLLSKGKEFKRESGVRDGGMNIIQAVADLLIRNDIEEFKSSVNKDIEVELKNKLISENSTKLLSDKVKEIHTNYKEYLETNQLD